MIALFGVAWLASQTAILWILAPLGSEIARLQTRSFRAEETLRILQDWEARGVLDAYRAHFVLDRFHPILYAGFFTALLCRLFEDLGVSRRWNFVLALPLLSGLLDGIENQIQLRFLASPDFSAVVDPLPIRSTLASDGKWLLVLAYAGASAVLLWRVRRSRVRPGGSPAPSSGDGAPGSPGRPRTGRTSRR